MSLLKIKISDIHNQKFILTAILLSTFLVRIPFLGEPLDRDSATFAESGYIFFKGGNPYEIISDTKPPGLPFLLSILFKFVDKNDFNIHIFTALWAVLTTFCLYILSKCLFGKEVGLIAAFIYGIYSSSPFLNGTDTLTENFLVTFTILGIYCFVYAIKKKYLFLYFISGILFSLAFTFKQVGIFEFISVVICSFIISLFFNKEDKLILFKRICLLFLGFLLVPGLIILYFYSRGSLSNFIFCVFSFNLLYVSYPAQIDFLSQLIFAVENTLFVASTNLIVWMGASIFLIIYLKDCVIKQKTDISKEKVLILALWCIFSFFGINYSYKLFPHYYITILPVLSIMSALIINELFNGNLFRKGYLSKAGLFIFIIFILFSLVYSFILHYPYYFEFSPEDISIAKYLYEPFPEAKQAGLYIKKKTKAEDYIYAWTEEPEIYFYANRNMTFKSTNYPFTYYREIFPNDSQYLLAALKEKRPIYFIIDTRHLKMLQQYKNIYNYAAENYYIEKEIRVIRYNVWVYSLLICRLK